MFKTRSRPIFELLSWFVLDILQKFSGVNFKGYVVTLVFLFSGFVQGEAGAEPRLMQFHPNFQHGALLTVVGFTFNRTLFFSSFYHYNYYPFVK